MARDLAATKFPSGKAGDGTPVAGPTAPTAVIDDYPSAVAGWGGVTLLFILYVLSLVDRNIMSLLIPNIRADLGISDVEIGVLVGAAFALFYAVAALPLGWAIDRYDRRVVIWLGVTVWSIGTMACGASRSFATFFAARALVGSGEAVLAPGSQSLLPEMFPREKLALPMSVYSLGAKVGGGASLIIGGFLVSSIHPARSHVWPILGEIHGWQLIFIVAGLPGLVLALCIFLFPDPSARSARPREATSFADYWRFLKTNWRFMVPHHAGLMPMAIVAVGIATWTPVFLSRVHGWSMEQTGLWLGLALLVGPTSTLPLHGLVVDRLFKRGMKDIHLRYLIITLLLGTPFGCAAFVVPSPELAVICLGLFYAIVSSYVSLPTVVMQIIAPSRLRGKVASVKLTLVSLVSSGTGPVVVAMITEYVFGDPAMVGMSLVICIAICAPLSALLYGLAMKPARKLLS